MSLDFAFWVGARPKDDEDALRIFDEFMDAQEEAAGEEPPSPAIQAFVDELLAKWPGDDENSLWAMFPLDAQGDLLYLNLVSSRPSADYDFIVAAAKARGLVANDPQSDTLL